MKKVINGSKFGLEKFTVAKLTNMIQIKGGDGSEPIGGGHDTDKTSVVQGPPPPPDMNH